MTIAAPRTAFRTCPLCEAGCGLEIDWLRWGRRRAGDPHPRRPRRRVQPRVHLPQGLDAQAAPRGPRPAAPAARAAGRRLVEVELGRGVRRDRAAADAGRRASTAATPSRVYLGNPNAHTSSGLLYLRPLLQALGTTQRVLRQHRRPDAQAGVVGLMFGDGADGPGARPRPHRLPADARRQPVRVQRQPVHRARLPGRLEAIRARGGTARRGRPPPQPDRRGGRRAPGDPARHRRVPAVGAWSTCWSPTASSTRARRASTSPASTSVAGALAAPFTPEAAADRHRARRRRRSGALARELAAAPTRRASTAASARTTARVRHPRVVAGRRPQRAHRQPRPPGRRHVPPARGRRRQHPGRAPRRARRPPRPAPQPGPGVSPRRWASCPVACLAEEIDTPGEGQIRALVTVAGNPVLSTPNAARLDAALGALDFWWRSTST